MQSEDKWKNLRLIPNVNDEAGPMMLSCPETSCQGAEGEYVHLHSAKTVPGEYGPDVVIEASCEYGHRFEIVLEQWEGHTTVFARPI